MKTYSLSLLRTLLAFAFLLIFFSCREEAAPQSLDGVYESIGYGRQVKIKNGEFVMVDKTDISCIPVMDGAISMFEDNLEFKEDTLRLKDGINLYQFKKLKDTLDWCMNKELKHKKNDPVYNFEVLASTFADHYAYFKLRQVNWDSLYAVTKQKITAATTEAELYVIMEDMLDSFNDGHIGLDAPGEIEDAADSLRNDMAEAPPSKLKRYGDFEIAQLVAATCLGDDKKTASNEIIQWGTLDDNIGYLQINLMMGHADLQLADSLSGNAYWEAYFGELENMTSEGHTDLEVAGLKKTLDSVFKDLADTDALVLDVRFNGGGKDEIGLEIMRRFNPEKHVVFSKKAKLGDGFTEPNIVYLEASGNAYTRPVFLLTSQQSASATEIMVLSSLLLEHVNRLGAHTEGVFSDVLDKVLPNGWEFGLSNEVYIDTKGINYEGKGIPPHIELDYSPDRQSFFRGIANDPEADKRTVLEALK